MTSIDWGALAKQVGADPMQGGSLLAQAALASILGDQALRDAVDCYVMRRPGGELARSVLWQLHPLAAMNRCRELVESSTDPDVREDAVELLRVVADARVLEWIPAFLADTQPGVQFWGLLIVDQLLFSHFIGMEEAEPIFRAADASANEKLREQAARVRRFYADDGNAPM
jgi:hypothetical protein